MLGKATVLFAAVGSIAGVNGFSSISSLDWDPSHIWRIGDKNKFYLFACSEKRPDQSDIERGTQWISSNLQVYLMPDAGVLEVRDGVKLKLEGIGFFKKYQNKKLIKSGSEEKVNLHEEIKNGTYSTTVESRFTLTVNSVTKNNRLGEAGGGEDAWDYGSMIMCDKQLFKFSGYENHGEKSAELLNVNFVLEGCDREENKYKGQRGCSIKIDSKGKGLGWADNFRPIVIN